MNPRETTRRLRMLEDLAHRAQKNDDWAKFGEHRETVIWLLGNVNVPIPEYDPDCRFCQAVTNAEELYLTSTLEVQAEEKGAA